MNRATRGFIGAASCISTALLLTGCPPKENGDVKEPIKIGTLSPLTGAAASYGKKLTQAVDLALEEANAEGGVNGQKLMAIHEDDKLDPKAAVSAAQKLVSVDKTPVIIGAVASSATLAVAPVAQKNEVVLITPISSADKISESGDYVFRIAPSDALQARDAAAWMQESGYKKAAVLFVNNDYGVGLRSAFEKEFAQRGGVVVAAEGFAQGAKDVKSQLAKIQQAQPEAMFVPSYIEEAVVMLTQRKGLGLKAQVFGTDPFHDPTLLENAGDAANGVWFMDVAGGSGPAFDAFAKAYKAKYNMDAEIIAAESYDAAVAIIKAVETAGSTDPAAIKDALHKVKFDGASGRIEFDANGDVPTKKFQRYAIEAGQYVEWKPKPAAKTSG